MGRTRVLKKSTGSLEAANASITRKAHNPNNRADFGTGIPIPLSMAEFNYILVRSLRVTGGNRTALKFRPRILPVLWLERGDGYRMGFPRQFGSGRPVNTFQRFLKREFS